MSDDTNPEKKTRKASKRSATGLRKTHNKFASNATKEARELVFSDRRLQETEKICELYLQGYSFFEISKSVGLNPHVVKSVVDQSRQVWIERHNQSLSDLTAEQISKIDMVESRAWESYYESRKLYLEKQDSSGSNDKGSFSSSRTTKRKQVGSAEFLNIILNCVKQRSELLGLGKRDENEGMRHNSMLVVVNTPDEARAIHDYQAFQKMVDGEIIQELEEAKEQETQG